MKPTTINLYDAKTNLSSIIERALDGETIVIAKRGQGLVKLVPIKGKPKKRKLGFVKVEIGPDFERRCMEPNHDFWAGLE
jgi:prevent-host-death family protein